MNKNNPSKLSYTQLMVALVCFGVVSAIGLSVNRWWISVPLTPLILLGVHYRRVLAPHWQAALMGLMLAVILVFSVNGVRIMRSNIAQPPEWDFLAFWLGGRVAVQEQNFYKPEYYQKAIQPFNPSEDFTREILQVGFRYPPPLRMTHADLALALTLLLALLLYPATLEHYSVLLLVPMLLLWMYRRNLPGGVWGVMTFITLVYGLVGYQNGNYVFAAIALNWGVLAGIGVWLLVNQTRQPDLSPISISSS